MSCEHAKRHERHAPCAETCQAHHIARRSGDQVAYEKWRGGSTGTGLLKKCTAANVARYLHWLIMALFAIAKQTKRISEPFRTRLGPRNRILFCCRKLPLTVPGMISDRRRAYWTQA